jgi:hypothetical protein
MYIVTSSTCIDVVSVEKSVNLIGYFMFLIAFDILSLFSVLIVLTVICHGEVLCHVWCPRGLLYLDGHLFLEIWKVSVIILLNMFLVPLAWTSFPFFYFLAALGFNKRALLGKSSSCLNHSVSPLLFQCP